MEVETEGTKAVTLLEKAPTGIEGFDDITGGGLPKGRPTLVCGSAGCGKTLFAMEFLVRGAVALGEPGVFVSFEERAEDLAVNVASLGFDLHELEFRNLLRLDQVQIERSEIEEAGIFDLEGLFIRLGYAIDEIGAKRVVLDTIESIFSSFDNVAILRSELRRLFSWLKEKGVTAIITGERGDGTLTRQGLEEYVSDCVVLLDHRIINQVSTRRLRIVKYRGSTHGTNEYPFLIDRDGFSVLPVTSLGLKHGISSERVSSGIPDLDAMVGGKGFFRGSSVLISGTSGTGKSSVCSIFVNAACARGEKCLYFAFEESEPQIVRNMRSIGLDLQPWIDSGRLVIHATRPMHFGLEMHLATMQKLIDTFEPNVVVVDPISNLESVGTSFDVSSMLIRLVDMLKARGITGEFVYLSTAGTALESTETNMSSVMDTWILLRDIELAGERNRGIYVLKARGMKHSNQIREFLITSHGVKLRDAYLGTEGVLTGSARVAQEAKDRAAHEFEVRESQRRAAAFEKRKKALEAQILALQAEIEAEKLSIGEEERQESHRIDVLAGERAKMATSRSSEKALEKEETE
jgi:circadian clock protein KaiC